MWMGPGKVVFQDGKVIFVRHGSVLVRVLANRLVKKNEDFATAKDVTKVKTMIFSDRSLKVFLPRLWRFALYVEIVSLGTQSQFQSTILLELSHSSNGVLSAKEFLF